MTGYDFVKNARFTHHDVAYEVRQVKGDGGVVCEDSVAWGRVVAYAFICIDGCRLSTLLKS